MEELRRPVLQGVHIDVSFLITRLGLPENFQDVEFIEARFVYKQLPNIMVVYDSSKITVADNKVSVIIPDTDSNRLIIGDYDLHFLYKKTNVLRPNLYEPFRLVLPAFKLVKTTAELGGVVPTNLEVQSVEIQGEMFIARDGLNGNSAFEIWQAFIGTPESTELDYLAWLRLPVDSAATDFDALTEQFDTFNQAANQAEELRNTKEGQRDTSEGTRLVDEQLRKNAEQARSTAEQARTLAEQTREQAEAERETLFDQSVDESVAATNAANAAANAQNAYNVTVAVPLAAGIYYTKTTARAAVPVASRKLGLVNTYALSASAWYTEKFIGTNVSGWTTEANWEQVPDAAKLATLETDLNYMYPSVGIAKRVLADAGTIKSRSTLNDLTNKFLDLLPNTKLLFCPHLAVKLRESGIYKYVTKLYDVGPAMLDGAQTTALNQPYLSGNIAPTGKYALKNPNNGNAYFTHTPISFLSTDKWSVSTMINDFCSALADYGAYCGNGTSASNIYLRKTSANRLRFLSNTSIEYLFNTNNSLIGKNSLITFVAFGNGTLNLYLNGKLFQSITSTDTSFIFSRLVNSYSTFGLNGVIQYHSIRDIALSPTQVQDEHNYLRTLFTEIESVQIGTQTWATSNCEMTCTPQGNVISEMQASTNVEMITNAADREFSSDTGFWTKQAGWTIEGGKAVVTSGATGSALFRSSGLIVGKWYKCSFTIESISGNLQLAIVSNRRGYITPGTYTAFLKCDATTYFGIICSGANTTAVIDNVSFQEIGWAGSTELYNGIYAQTEGTAEQKEYAAVKASAMWRNANNDPVLASVYGKKFNKYARKLLAMDIAYYNAANPTALWGWDIPTQAQLTTLATNGGNALKVGGTNYWNTANGINLTGLTLLGGGYIDANGNYIGNKTHEGVWSKDADIARVALDVDNSFNEVAATTEGYSTRLIKV